MVRLLTRPFSEHSVGKGRFAVAREICGDDRELVRELWGSLPPGQTRFGVSGQEQHDRPEPARRTKTRPASTSTTSREKASKVMLQMCTITAGQHSAEYCD
jgi:hypothetical protein